MRAQGTNANTPWEWGRQRERERVPGPTLREHQRLLCGTPTIRAVSPWDRGRLQASLHGGAHVHTQLPGTEAPPVWEPLGPPVRQGGYS